MRPAHETIVLTDLDHTLLDASGPMAAGAAVARVTSRGVLVIPTTSKTATETLMLMGIWGLRGPAVVENGAALCLPTGANRWRVLRLSRPGYAEVRATLRRVRRSLGVEVSGFGDWDLAQLRRRTGLTPPWALAARQRLASEPLQWHDEPPSAFMNALHEAGLAAIAGGRFLTVLPHGINKASGARSLLHHWRPLRHRPRVIAIGDAPNDRELLRFADASACLSGPASPGDDLSCLRFPDAGPRAWLDALHRLGVI